MDKQDALNKIKELEKYIEDIDKKKLVRVYVKEWDERPDYWNGEGKMDYMKGQIFDDMSKYCYIDRVHIHSNGKAWILKKEDVIFVEGSFDDLQYK